LVKPAPFTYRRLAMLCDVADRLAGHRAAPGPRRGQRVAVWLPSRVETAIGLLGRSHMAEFSEPHAFSGAGSGKIAKPEPVRGMAEGRAQPHVVHFGQPARAAKG
jgi:hypothetical protein